jgi:iron complex outermembrane receptor protein
MSSRFTAKLYQVSSLLCLAGITIPATAFADPATSAAASPAEVRDTGTQGLAEIVVTANKVEEASSKVGMTIQTIDDKALATEHIATLEDLAYSVPGLTFTQTESSTPVYTLRGVGFYETSLAAYPDVSVYLDQAPLPFPVQTTLSLFDVQRVEVLKGPQGTLFGNNATGGAINYIANKPTPEFAAGTQVSYGRYNTGQIDGFVSGPLSNTLLGRFSFTTTASADGWQHSQTREDTNGRQDKFAARAILDWHATDALRFELNVNGWYDGSQPQQPQDIQFKPNFPSYSPAVLQPPAPNDANVADWSDMFGAPKNNESLLQTFLRTDYDLTSTITLSSITNYIYYYRDDRPDADGTFVAANETSLNKGWMNSYSQELRLAGGGEGPFRWLGGVNYSGDHVREYDAISWPGGTTRTFGPTAGSLGNDDFSNQRMSNYAAFGHVEYDILSQLKLKLGVRGTEADRQADICGISYDGTALAPNGIIQNFVAFNAAYLGGRAFVPVTQGQCVLIGPPPAYQTGEFNTHLNEHNVSWSGGLDWKPTDTLLVYGNVARGFKAGGFPTLPASIVTALAPVTQEKLTDYEAGFKAQFFDRRLLVNGAGFYYDYRDKQLKSRIIDPLFGVLTALVNIPKSSIRGAEFEVHARPLTGLDLGVQGTYLSARIDTFTGVNQVGQVGSFAGSAMPYTPKWNLSASTSYEHSLTDQWLGFVGAQIAFKSETTAAIGSPALYDMPAYTVLNLQAGVKTQDDRLSVFLWGKNVTNRFYVNNVVELEDDVIRYTGMPITYGISVGYRFK